MSVTCHLLHRQTGECDSNSFSQKRAVAEVGDIFREYGQSFCEQQPQPLSHLRVIQAIRSCRTASLGGHIDRCSECGFERNAYNSCRNRHCPKCQTAIKVQWLEDRKADLLPVNYFHTVFTLPHELNPLILRNKQVMLNLLFKSVSETLLTFGKNNIEGQLGFLSVLHTWDQTLGDHFHLHCVIAAGALSLDKQRWIPTRKNYLFPVKTLSKVYRGKFMDFLKKAYSKGDLTFPGQISHLENETEFKELMDSLWKKEWVVYSKRPFDKPEKVLDYLARYTHRVAISNHRIVSGNDGKVTFKYKDRKQGNEKKMMTLSAHEFIRRFLLHVIPAGLMRIRYFGFMANRYKQENLNTIRELMGIFTSSSKQEKLTTEELIWLFMGIDVRQCPVCQEGTMVRVGMIARGPPPYVHQAQGKKG